VSRSPTNEALISAPAGANSEDVVATADVMPYEGITASKVASSGPLMSETQVDESPEARKLRRLGELLKKVVPTQTVGSVTPTPPRGTP